MIKKTTSLTLAFSGLVLLASSVVLYIGPPTHVGHFSPWQCLGLSKHHWGAVHLNCGVLFCIAMVVHTWFNWGLIVAYIRRKTSRFYCLPLVLSLFLTLFFSTGSFHHAPPMKQIMGLARYMKYGLVKQYGSPPYGSASAYPIKTIAGYMGWNAEAAMGRLDENRIQFTSPSQSLAEVAKINHTTIGRVLDIMHGGKGDGDAAE